ncbi:hypothetical protein BGX24_006021, partial [Mortierella sp. AD032]
SRLPGPSSRTSHLMTLTKMQQPAAVQTTSTINSSIPPKPQISPMAPGARRCSADFSSSASSAGLISPKNVLAVNRRRSLDQMRAALAASGEIVPGARTADSMTRRDSDASTSDTIVSSGQSSCSTLVHPMMALADNDSRTQLDKMQSSPSSSPSSSDDTIVESPEINATASTMTMSSASSLAAMRRASSASEPGIRSSLDLRSMTSPRQGDMYTKARHRRSMQEPLDASFFSPRPSATSPLTSSISASSFGDSLPHIPKMDGGLTKQRASFSGSATVSGRFSRFWSYASGRESPDPAAVHSKDNSAGTLGSVTSNNSEAPWTMTDMGNGYYYSEKDIPANGRKSRNGVMTRLSGLWSRR